MVLPSDFEVVSVAFGKDRINFADLVVKPTSFYHKRFFRTNGFLWGLQIKTNRFFLANGNKPHIEKIIGRFSFGCLHIFVDGDTNDFELKVLEISIGTLVPEEIRDVILYHEHCEAFWRLRVKFPIHTAHRLARWQERIYLKKFLTDREKKVYRDFCQEVKSVEWEPYEIPKDQLGKGIFKEIDNI